jgi:hypothetical protein
LFVVYIRLPPFSGYPSIFFEHVYKRVHLKIDYTFYWRVSSTKFQRLKNFTRIARRPPVSAISFMTEPLRIHSRIPPNR